VAQAIFLDSTALYTLGSSMTNPDFQALTGLRSFDWPCKICTSRVNWLEYLRQRKEQVLEVNTRLSQIARDLDKLEFTPEDNTALTALGARLIEHMEQLEKLYEDKAKEIDLIITPIPKNASLDLYVSLAMECIPPFERKNEKGFRDAVSLFSYFEYAQEQNLEDVLVVSNDNLFGEAAKRFAPDYSLNVTVVKTIPAAYDAVIFGASWIIQRRQMEANWGAMYYLETRLDMLTTLVADINPYDRVKYAQQFLSFLSDQRRVLLVDLMRFVELAAASHDYRGTDKEALFFRLKCEMVLLLQPPESSQAPAERVTMPIELYGSVKVRDEGGIKEISPAYIDRAAPPTRAATTEIPEVASGNTQE
jgi:hypothetical protein